MSRILGKYNLITLNDLNTFINSGIIQLDSINKKGTKILEKSKYIYFINILKQKLFIEKDDYIIPFFAEKKIYIPKIIINGYINLKLSNDENKMILFLINKIFPIMMTKEYFFYIYKKLSKIYMKKNLINDNDNNNNENLFQKFINILDIWKIMYSFNDDSKLEEKYISFFGNNSINIKIPIISKYYLFTEIIIYFVKSPLFSILNQYKNNFSFIKLYKIDKIGNKNEICNLKYNDIIKLNNEKYKKVQNNINKIKFSIYEGKISYIINENENENEIKNEIINDENNIDKFNKLKLLNNFNGKISHIELFRIYNKDKKEILRKIVIKPDKKKLNINYFYYKKKENENKYEIFEEKIINENIDIIIKNNNGKNIFYKYYPEILYTDIKYYGGLESFLPILKIFKYIFKKINDKDNKIKDSFKNIFKIMINIIYYSEKNLLNFFEIIIPLVGSLSEINDLLNEQLKNEIYKNSYFSYIYILIMISPSPNNVKKMFQNIIGINENNKYNFIFTDLKNSEKILMRYNSLDWYSFMLFIFIEFIILTTNDIEKVPKSIFSLLLNIFNSLLNNIKIVRNLDEIKKTRIMLTIKLFIGIIYNFYPKSIDIPEGFLKIDDYNIPNFINGVSNYKEYFIHIFYLIIKIYFYLNKMNLINFKNSNKNKNKNDECSYSKFYTLFLSLKDVFIIKEFDNQSLINDKINLKNKFKKLLCEFPEHKSLILELLNENMENIFIKKEEKILNEFVDYNRQYRHLMKELFIFNRPWSNNKLFFSSKKKNMLKYKNINYYTNNFQRPLIYPILDYKKQYPDFSYYNIDNNFYYNEENNIIENNDNNFNYDFELESPELNKLNEIYNNKLINEIKNEYIKNIQIFEVCLIKRTHHIKGKLFTLSIDGILNRIYFYSYSKKENEELPSCNNTECNKQQFEFHNYEKNNHLCYGSLFPCPLKDSNIKICIKINDIRFIIKRIYFYRKSGIEFFTGTKSYLFNFAENPLLKNYEKGMAEKNNDILINLLVYYSQDQFYPININNQIIGYSRIFINIFNKSENIKNNIKNEDLIFIKNKYINDLINNWIKIDKKNNIEKGISSFDAIIYLNLLSNRSYNDIYQYPIFPLLFFYDKENNNYKLIERDLDKHIGFQSNTKMSEKRKKKIINSFELSKDEIENGISQNENAYYFESNFSNVNYISNFLLRIFPYTFLVIELNGDGYDKPERLFDSIENTFYNISSNENDLRELIPEFFYFPEMFLNINKLNFNNNDNININNVKIPLEFYNNNNNNNDNNNDNNLNENSFYFCCKFIEKMRSNLENRFLDVYKWCNIIFGTKQKYNNKKEQLFKTETYINFNKETGVELNKYLNNDEIMNSVEYGLLPVQIIFDEIDLKKIQINQNKNNNLNYIKEKISINKNNILTINNNNNNNIINDSEKILNIKINENNNILIVNCYKSISKIEIIINNKIEYEFYENIDSIIYLNYNKRLNIFVLSSIDGYLCLYVLPGKLINIIKHPLKEHFFDYVILSSNPFPSIIAFDKLNNTLYSYSINGIFICKKQIFEIINDEYSNIHICPIFDEENGIHKDLLFIQVNNQLNIDLNKIKFDKSNIILNVPFFENIEYNNI